MQVKLSDHFHYRTLLKFVFPSVCMMVFTSIYGVVDGLFVSNFAGKTPFAAINLIMPFLMIMGAVGFMLGAGGSAIVSRTFGEATSTNPMATIFAWSGALKKRGELDSLPALVQFGEALEAASLQTLNDGIMTKDLCGLAEGITPTQVNSEEFIQAIRTRLEAKLA